MTAAENKTKTDAELSLEFVTSEVTRQALEPLAILARLTGYEPNYMGCPRVN
jgi:hypothetical protein